MRPLLWLSHFPVLSLESTVRDPVIVLTGHLHVRAHAIAGNVLQLNMASLAEAPHDASVVTVETHEDAVAVRRTCHRVLDGDDGDEAAAFAAEHTAFNWNGTAWSQTR